MSDETASRPLTPKQEAFVAEYLKDLNATQAAIRAGYSAATAEQQGSRLLRNAQVAARIAELQEARAERTQISQDYVLSNLTEVLERCMTRAPVMVRQGREMVQAQDEEGRHVWDFNSKGALGALKLLGDHLGMYSTNLKVSTPPGESLKVVTAAVTPDELEGLDAQALARLYFGGKP